MARKKKRSSKKGFSPKDLLRLFREIGRPLKRRDILKSLHVSKSEWPHIESILSRLTQQGKVIRSGNAWGLVEKMPLLAGTLEVQRSGVGFVIPEDKRRRDVFVNPDNFGSAWHGDRVMVAILPGRRGKNPAGRIVRILQRGHEKLSALVTRLLGSNQVLARPTEQKLDFSLVVNLNDLPERPNPGDVIVVKPGEKMEKGLWEAEAERLLGREKDLEVQEEIVKTNHSIPTSFPPRVLQAAEELPGEPGENEFSGRRDLRQKLFVTIDGEKAKDFDDAILVEPRGRDFVLLVAIADVSHYVHPESTLDLEARERANSYYFPQSVEPMLPESLSNGLCSLKPDVPRLVMAAEMVFGPDGHRRESRFFPGVIVSKARLTYTQVKKALLDKDKSAREELTTVLPMLQDAEKLARILQRRRSNRGSLDFDLPEPEILFNLQGETVDIRPKARHFAHQIIEEFMIAANEAVAEFLRDRDQPILYRIHPEPDADKIDSLFRLLERSPLGSELPEDRDQQGLQALLKLAEDTSLEFLVNRMLLRTMMQAKYAPENQGHFGLASECYCHFTSPIRRYADLVVHRAMKSSLGLKGPAPHTLPQLTRMADHLNTQERKAMQAEREIVDRLTIIFLEDRVGEEFTGIIASMSDYGFWVELSEVMAEGMVRLSSLQDDYYVFLPDRQQILGERTGRSFSLGDQVRVSLTDVNLSRQEVTLEIVGDSSKLETRSSKKDKKSSKAKTRRSK